MTGDAERIIRQQLAEHGDGERAMAAAEQATGLPAATLRGILHALMSGKGGRPVPRIGGPAALKGADRTMLERCQVCGNQVARLGLHRRRHHPDAK